MGGRDNLRIVLKGGAHLSDVLLSKAQGGTKLERGIGELVAERPQGPALEIEQLPGGPAYEIRAEAEDSLDAVAGQGSPDLVVFDLEADIFGSPDHPVTGRLDLEAYIADLKAVVDLLKVGRGSHIFFVNASTVDPTGPVRNYHRLTADPIAIRIHKLDLALIELSYQTGISIIDVDRVLAEMGAGRHVRRALDYSPEACAAIADEFVRVLDDYGFFEERPLLMQVGTQD